MSFQVFQFIINIQIVENVQLYKNIHIHIIFDILKFSPTYFPKE